MENDNNSPAERQAFAQGDGAQRPAPPQDEGDEISLVDLAATLWRRKWLIVGVTFVAAVFSVVYALLQPNMYTAASTLLPISGSASSSLAQYAGLAAMAGISLPGASASDPTVKIEAILKSRGLAEKLIEELDLIPVFIKKPEKVTVGTPLGAAIKTFQEDVFSISTDAKTSLIKVSAKTKDPALSRDIANKAIELLQANLEARTLSASGKNIALLETQVVEQEAKVRAAQAKLAEFQRKNKLVSPQAQSSGGIQLYQGLIQQRIALEIEISRLESALSSDNPKLVAAKTQLAAINNQISDYERTGGGVGPSISAAPATMMEYATLSAELELLTKLYGSLVGSLESMKLQEASEKLFIEVIDPAIAPERKSEPSRAMICVVGTLAGGFLSVLLAFVLDALKKLVADPEVRAKFGSARALKKEKAEKR
jgi:uncharacterized protein involved in exopolysaccharide biosynthesis